MNKKGRELENRLNKAKIIDVDLVKSLEQTAFLANLEKKNQDIKLFSQEAFSKVKI